MKYDVIVIGGGASGLMAAYSAASHAAAKDNPLRVCVLEKMPRPGRKIMITGKGRCNFTNVKDWNEFSSHIRSGSQFVRPAWRCFPPDRVIGFFESAGMPTIVERGDRAYPASYRSTDVVDALVRECLGAGVKIETEAEVIKIEKIAGNSRIALAQAAGGRQVPADFEISSDSAEILYHEAGACRPGAASPAFTIHLSNGTTHRCNKLIIATGGLSYPATGSTGDGYGWATSLGHTVTPLFPSLTALVPRGYKVKTSASSGERQNPADIAISSGSSVITNKTGKVLAQAAGGRQVPADFEISSERAEILYREAGACRPGAAYKKHWTPRDTPLSEFGTQLCGVQLKNIGVNLLIQGTVTDEEFGDIDFTDGGIEGPIGFQLSRKAVKALTNGSKVSFTIDLKPGVPLTELTNRIKELWAEIDRYPRSTRLREKERCRILLGKLMPRELIPGFTAAHPGIITLERRGRADTKVWVNLVSIAKALKEWKFDIDGFVGWERAVITAGGISTDEIIPKTMESRLVPGLYFCGEAIDIDADTGGYNLQLAFCTGWLAGLSASS